MKERLNESLSDIEDEAGNVIGQLNLDMMRVLAPNCVVDDAMEEGEAIYLRKNGNRKTLPPATGGEAEAQLGSAKTSGEVTMAGKSPRSRTKGLTPIWANETTAAALMDMTVTEFRSLVDGGHLPPGREIAPGYVRWFADELTHIASGDAINEGPYQW